MQLGMVGLGRMGSNMVKRLLNNGHTAVVYDRAAQVVQDLEKQKAVGAS
ncbi:MAG: NAD(P)-binding domain-containing protein, partial [Terracidiphilus sp.]